MRNRMKVEFEALPENEGFARVAVASFITPVNPTVEEISDIKTAVSEAVTNAVIHGYEEKGGIISILCVLEDNVLHMEIEDFGKGIENVEQAMEPLFTTAPEEERAGLGFAVMESLMDRVKVVSHPGKGTTVTLEKRIVSKAGEGDAHR